MTAAGTSAPVAEGIVDRHARGIISTSGLLLLRKGVVTLGAAISTAVITRQLSTELFGVYASALATFYLAQAFCDLGFSAVLARELAVQTEARPQLLRATVRLAMAWSLLIAAGYCGFVLATSGPVQLTILLVLAPALALTGSTVARQWFVMKYDVRWMASVDTACNLVQVVALIIVALAGGGPVHLAVVICVTSTLNTLIVATAARRQVGSGKIDLTASKPLLLMALPIGLPSVLASAYFSVDLVIAGHIVAEDQVARYAAAVKLLTMITALSSILVGVALPGLSAARESADPRTLGNLVGRIWHWLVALGLPLCVAIACYAELATRVFFGQQYLSSAEPLRVLMVTAGLSLLGGLFGVLMIATRRTAATLGQNLVALAASVGLNFLLLPRIGIMAAAWLSLATEFFLIICSFLLLRKSLHWTPFLRVSRWPLVACAAAGLLALAPIPSVALRLTISTVVFVILMSITRAWPFSILAALRKVVARRSAPKELA